MVTLKVAALALGLTLAGSVFACSEDGKGGILPENDFYIPINFTIFYKL
jgi:hypothetical protein